MTPVLTYTGRDYLLDKIVNKNIQMDSMLHLYTNDVTPKNNDTIEKFIEPVIASYSPRILYGIWWDSKGKIKRTTEIDVTFEFSNKIGNVYGYFVSENGVLLWAERFEDGPYEVQQNDIVKINQVVSLEGCENI